MHNCRKVDPMTLNIIQTDDSYLCLGNKDCLFTDLTDIDLCSDFNLQQLSAHNISQLHDAG